MAAHPFPVGEILRFLHLVAAAYWLGGLIALALVAAIASRRLESEAFASLMSSAGNAFMWGAIVAAAVLATSGIALAAGHLKNAGELASTAWGRTLLEKTGLVVVAAALAALHSMAGRRAAVRRWRIASRALSPAILLVTLGIFYLAARLAAT